MSTLASSIDGDVQGIKDLVSFLLETLPFFLTISGVAAIGFAIYIVFAAVINGQDLEGKGNLLLPGVMMLVLSSVLTGLSGDSEVSTTEKAGTEIQSKYDAADDSPIETAEEISNCSEGDTVTVMGHEATIHSKELGGWLSVKNAYGEISVVSASELSCDR